MLSRVGNKKWKKIDFPRQRRVGRKTEVQIGNKTKIEKETRER